MHFMPMEEDIEHLPLAENEVLFVPQSLAANLYITYYSSGYILQDIGTFVDPKGVQNTKAFNVSPCWGRCKVYRSSRPHVKASISSRQRLLSLASGLWLTVLFSPPGSEA